MGRTVAGTALGLGMAAGKAASVFSGVSKAKKWRSNCKTSRKTRRKKINKAGSYRPAVGDAIATLMVGSGVNSWMDLADNIAKPGNDQCGCQ